MAGIVPEWYRATQPGTGHNARYSPLIRQAHPRVVTDLNARCDHDLPDMAVGIGDIARITAVVGDISRLQQPGALRQRERQGCADLLDRAAVPGQRHATEAVRTRGIGQRGIAGEIGPWIQQHLRAAGVEVRYRLAGRAEFPGEAERRIERDASAHFADTERDDREARYDGKLIHLQTHTCN